MKRPVLVLGLLLTVTAGGAGLRLVSLDNRPMHCDEGVHAVKFGELLEKGKYEYDPAEYHGPGLNYLTLPIAWLAGAARLTDVTEVHLRLLLAVFGIALIAGTLLLWDGLGPWAAVCAAALAAVSPAMIFFSRYYIQEMLLVCFTFFALAACWRWLRSDRPAARAAWLVLAGVCFGMMHVAKETCAIAVFAMVVAAAAMMLRRRRGVRASQSSAPQAPWPRLKCLAGPAGLVLLVAVVVSVLFYSSFFTNADGPADSIRTYTKYVHRAAGTPEEASWHVHPWHYYAEILLWWHHGGAVWTEAFIIALAVAGFGFAIAGRGAAPGGVALVRFLGVYTIVMVLVYSILPYKTPWCMLGFLHGLILLGGFGAVQLVRAAPGRAGKAAAAVVLLAAGGHLGWQGWRGSFAACEDPGNPYVYAHTTSDVRRLVARIEEYAAVHPDGHGMPIQVICPAHDYWPLPWNLRRFTRAGFDDHVPDKGAIAPVVITQPALEADLTRRIFEIYEAAPFEQRHLYMTVFENLQLRHGVPLRAYVRKDLWEAWAAAHAPEVPQ